MTETEELLEFSYKVVRLTIQSLKICWASSSSKSADSESELLASLLFSLLLWCGLSSSGWWASTGVDVEEPAWSPRILLSLRASWSLWPWLSWVSGRHTCTQTLKLHSTAGDHRVFLSEIVYIHQIQATWSLALTLLTCIYFRRETKCDGNVNTHLSHRCVAMLAKLVSYAKDQLPGGCYRNPESDVKEILSNLPANNNFC